MKRTKLSRMFALAVAFVMVFATVTLFNSVQVHATSEAQVLRGEMLNGDAAIAMTGTFVTGNTYTMEFWFYNEVGESDTVWVEWGHWPTFDDENPIYEGSAPLGQWVRHQFTFTGLAGATTFQIAPEWHDRNVGDVFYISTVTITAANGTVQTFAPADMVPHWSTSVATADVVANPAPTAVGGGGGTTNPPTGDNFSPLWLIVSAVGLVAALATLTGVVVYKKKK
jgi:hypothetical protein